MNDYLGKAAINKHQAKAAIKAKKFDVAWRLLNEQKTYYMKHANCSGFTKAQVIALDGTVHEDLANILQLEKNHIDALVNIIYWAMSGTRTKKAHVRKLTTYFNRCKFEQVSLSVLLGYYEQNIDNSITLIQAKEFVSKLC